MDYYKSALFSEEHQQLASLFKALAHPARLAILEYIAQSKSCISGDISDEIPLSRTTISQHLTALKDVGFIKGEISGSKTNYCLNTKAIQNLELKLNEVLGKFKVSDSNGC